MKIAIVYESLFGNTEALTGAVATGLRARGAEVVAIRAGEPGDHDLHGIDLLVLAAPTHALSLSRSATRADAVTRGAQETSARSGIRDWLLAAAERDDRPPVAVFDTRARVTRHWPGSAARTASRMLRRMGFSVVESASFYVASITGPLLPGEMDRARFWGQRLAEAPARGPSVV
ncbi:MAG: flavodoxin [Nocardioides sp.]|jgi:flavorubredoxin|nr:flavodoxin [Nocardioides sp.]